MVSAVGPDQRDSAGQEEARKTTRATSPETDLSSSVPGTVKRVAKYVPSLFLIIQLIRV